MIVCIAEKPSVARDIAHVLGATQSRDGYIEGNGYQVTWTFGHLCELKEPHEYNVLWKSWSLSSLPMIPSRFGIKLKEDKGIEKQFGIIERLMQQAEMIINCGDAGQEGELIQRWVMQKAGATCPVKRLWISSLTEEAIREGFQQLKDQSEYQTLYEAGLSRAIGDWTLGMNATRLYTLKYAQGKQVLSIGRVQTPTLALIVNRQHEIEHFTPEAYWVLTTTYRDTTFTVVLDSEEEESSTNEAKKEEKKGRENTLRGFTNEEEGRKALEQIKEAPFTITSVTKKNGTEAPPRLFDLTSLQVECNKKFGYSAEQTLQLIQSLYEKKVTTYPRVDTTFLSDDIYPKCGNILNGIAGEYGPLLQPLRGAKLRKSKKVFDSSKVTDHHAIIPTGTNPRALSSEEKQVFDLVARRFIAVFYPDCKFTSTTVFGETAEIPFKATGKQILETGWRDVYADRKHEENESGHESVATLPSFAKGESGPHTPDLAEKWTQAPKPYTEATLLRAMETAGKLVENEELRDALKENGIGRPSTRAAIIETLFKRRYIRKERKSLYATSTGVELIGLIREELLKSAELTGQWERKLRLIEKKNYDAKAFLDELKEMVTQIVHTVLSDNSNRRVTETVDTPKAGKKSGGKQETTKTPKKRTKRTTVVKEGDLCPRCRKGTIIRGKTALGCSEWHHGCDFRQPFSPES